MFKSRILHKMKIYNHRLSPMRMQNSYSEFIFAIKTLSVDKFSFFFRSYYDKLKSRCFQKCFYFPPSVKNYLEKFSIRRQILHTIRLNPRRGHRRVPGNQVLGVSFFYVFFFLSFCAILVVLEVSERRASACLVMLSAKQGSHWYHF